MLHTKQGASGGTPPHPPIQHGTGSAAFLGVGVGGGTGTGTNGINNTLVRETRSTSVISTNTAKSSINQILTNNEEQHLHLQRLSEVSSRGEGTRDGESSSNIRKQSELQSESAASHDI